MYTLHIANKNYSSWSLRPWVLMKELGIAFEEVLHVFGDKSDWDNYKKVNKSGLVPCLIAGQNTIWDSLAIVEYLAERHEGVWPQSDAARAWARSVTAEMHSGFSALRNTCSMTCGQRVSLNSLSPSLSTDLARIDALWQEGINQFAGPFLAGSTFSAVDAFYAPVVFRLQTYSIELSPLSSSYMEKILSLDSMKLWYAQALEEPFRDKEHDLEVAANGKVVADLRHS